MKNIVKACLAVAGAIAIAGCGMDSVQLGEYVRQEMQEELVRTDGLKALKMKEVRLIRGEGNNYAGVGKGELDGALVKFDVKCQYDGKTVLCDATLSEDNLLSLAAKEKAKAVYEKIKAAWPDIERSIKKKYHEASKKVLECCDAAAKKAEQCVDSAREKLQD